jgi:hypothetical protein
MKNFQQYLAESERTYNYRLKFVGDLEPSFLKALEDKLKQFDIVKMSAAKTTPVQLKPADFPSHDNERVTHMDVEFRYPAIEPQIQQLSQLLGMSPNRVRMLTVPYEENMLDEKEKIEDQNTDLLTNTDYPKDDARQTALKADYSAPYDEHAVLKNTYRSDFTVAGGKTPPAKTTNDLPMGVNSPMTKMHRKPKPPTGAQPRG